MGSSSSSSSTPNDSDCYMRNKMMRQQCLRTHPDNQYINPKSTNDNNYNGKKFSLTDSSMLYTGKIHMQCDCQGNIIECDENGRTIHPIKSNNR